MADISQSRIMEYDRVFHAAGRMGRSQILIILISYLVMLCAGWQILVPVFVARDVDFICRDNLTNQTVVVNTCYHECFNYAYEEDFSSITKEFSLDCGPKKYYGYFIHSSYWLGYLVSNLFVGYLGKDIEKYFLSIMINDELLIRFLTLSEL